VSAATNFQGMTPRRDRTPAAVPQPTRPVIRPEILPHSFYLRDDVVAVSRDLLGKVLCTDIDGRRTSLVITETEAYTDKASHAYGDRRTRRTEPMYGPGGMAYVYLCYGIHHLFNVVTNVSGVPHAVLVRAGEPHSGMPIMLRRRGKSRPDRSLLAGPGSVALALGITTELTGSSLLGGPIRIEDHGLRVDEACIGSGPRVGVDYAGEDAHRPYRFCLQADGFG
jgi:DNA-3-methyladenine glycosylase